MFRLFVFMGGTASVHDNPRDHPCRSLPMPRHPAHVSRVYMCLCVCIALYICVNGPCWPVRPRPPSRMFRLFLIVGGTAFVQDNPRAHTCSSLATPRAFDSYVRVSLCVHYALHLRRMHSLCMCLLRAMSCARVFPCSCILNTMLFTCSIRT
jgi:hypothetical protein